MLDHIEIEVADLDKSREFYTGALQPLGYTLKVQGQSLGFGDDRSKDFWIKPGIPSDRPLHYAYTCQNRAQVEEAYRASLSCGGRDDRAPALSIHIHPNYYAAYVLDPDGNRVEFVCHKPPVRELA